VKREPSLHTIARRARVTPGGLLLKTVERNHVLAVLAACDDSRTQAAKALGLHRRTLQRMLVEYGREPDTRGVERMVDEAMARMFPTWAGERR
jgi:DNA-binding NtrC family response regulator